MTTGVVLGSADRTPHDNPTAVEASRDKLVAGDEFTLSLLARHVTRMEERARLAGAELVADAFVFSDAVDGSEPWKPGAVTRYFGRLRDRLDLGHVKFRSLRRFMGTYGQDLGFSLAQVAIRAGHDPAVAAKHYTGKVAESDRALAEAVSMLLREENLG